MYIYKEYRTLSGKMKSYIGARIPTKLEGAGDQSLGHSSKYGLDWRIGDGNCLT